MLEFSSDTNSICNGILHNSEVSLYPLEGKISQSVVQKCTLLSIPEESDIIMLFSKFGTICEKDFFGKEVGKWLSASSLFTQSE